MFADDLVVGFDLKSDAVRFWAELIERNAKLQPRTASRENATGIRTVRGWKLEEARRRETGDVQLPRLYPHLREEEEQWTGNGFLPCNSALPLPNQLQRKLNFP